MMITIIHGKPRLMAIWMSLLPFTFLTIEFRDELNRLEEEQTMRYVTSIEQLAMAEGVQQGVQQGRTGGMIEMFLDTLALRFPNFDLQAYKDKVFSAAEEQIKRYNAKLFTAQTPEEVFADDDLNEKK
jgi:hypothetical protein